MKSVFINPHTKLLRAGWRIAIFFAIFIAITAAGMMAVRTILGGLPRGSNIQFVILCATATLAVFIARRYLDRQSFASLGLTCNKQAFADVLSGIGISAVVMAGMYTLLLTLGLIEFEGMSYWTGSTHGQLEFAALTAIGGVVLQLAIVAWWEELVMRGYLLQNLITGAGVFWAIVISSLIFGFGHAMNPNATLLSSILIVVITPQLIYAYFKTGQLWLPMGLHFGWNFFQASVFGFAASGQESASLILQSPSGPEWLSGGAFGAEGSILIVPLTIASYAMIHAWVRYSRNRRQPFFAIATS